MSLLPLIILIPLLTAVAQLAVPGRYRVLHRALPIAATGLTAALAVLLFLQFDSSNESYQFISRIPGLGAPSIGIEATLGVDGLSIGLILMGAIVAFAATCTTWEIQHREKEFHILLLLMTGGILGAFASLDLFFFYFFHEVALIPTFIMIGIWGRGEERGYAAFKMTLYLSLGALILLAGLIALYLHSGANTFNMQALSAHVEKTPLDLPAQQAIFPLLLFGFGILVSLWPFHTWAPVGYEAAPTSVAMLHAGVLKKFGLYGLIRLALPLLPDASRPWLSTLAVLCLGNLVWCGFVAMRQRNLNLLFGNSSVAHMGFIFLGIASNTFIGVTGAVVIMVAHGFLAALSFGLSGHLYQQTRTLDMDQLGGLAKKIPFIGTALIMAMLAGCGLPGFANFVGEVMVFFGAWTKYMEWTIVACWAGLVIGGITMIRAIRTMLHGPLPERWNSLADAQLWRRLPFVLLLAALILFGMFPRLLTDKTKAGLSSLVIQSSGVPVIQSAQTLSPGSLNHPTPGNPEK